MLQEIAFAAVLAWEQVVAQEAVQELAR